MYSIWWTMARMLAHETLMILDWPCLVLVGHFVWLYDTSYDHRQLFFHHMSRLSSLDTSSDHRTCFTVRVPSGLNVCGFIRKVWAGLRFWRCVGGSGAPALRLGASRVTQWIRWGRVPPKGLRGIQLPKGIGGVGIIEQWVRFGVFQ